ncbi:MAG: tRNA lysidine(34) synthetase TilS [Actinobacteria bacterium]|nr:tRNA lysidine(34) synthetase TilS [Actinomycetota bacterium]
MTTCLLGAGLAEPVTATIDRYRMVAGSAPVLLAFSGGADSTALALVLVDLGYPVVLGHVDHGMRAESAADADHCRRVARRLGVQILCRRVTVDPPSQAEARRVRYLALEEMAAECGAERIATGHTRDDQAETVLLRLRRGGYGLGIPPIRSNVIRPLIEVSRSQTERACREAGVEFLNDPSNQNARYRRVAVRFELARAGSGEVNRLLRVGEKAAQAAAEVALSVDAAWARLVEAGEERLRISRAGLVGLDPQVARQLLHRAGKYFNLELSGRLIKAVLLKVPARTGARLDLPEGFSVWSEPHAVVIGRWPEAGRLGEYEIPVGSRAQLPDWGIEFTFEPVSADTKIHSSATSEVVDSRAVGSSVVVRQWRPGDRFKPLGGPGTKKLQDFFVDAKVPRSERGAVPIVTAGERIVWVAGYRLDDGARVTGRSTAAVRLSVNTIHHEPSAR